MIYALDTNIVGHLIQRSPIVRAQRDAVLDHGSELIIPPFVNYEIRRGFFYQSAPVREKAYILLCLQYPIGEMTVRAWEHAANIYASLRRRGYTIEDADILIAAFCLVNSYILVTNNTRHFERIDGLQLVDWTQK